jgi:hypothetical protein
VSPVERFVPRFAAEPPQETLPYGRWAERLRQEFLTACLALQDAPEDLGEPGEVLWYPDRTWHGRTFVPATSLTTGGYEIFGYVRFVPAPADGDPSDFTAHADFTDELASGNPEWRIDICEEVIGHWRGEGGVAAAMTLVWGHPLVSGGAIVTAELGEATVDQCELEQERFTLLAPDDYRHDLLEIKLWSAKGQEVARESLYEGDEDGDAEGDEDADMGEDGAFKEEKFEDQESQGP